MERFLLNKVDNFCIQGVQNRSVHFQEYAAALIFSNVWLKLEIQNPDMSKFDIFCKIQIFVKHKLVILTKYKAIKKDKF